MKPQNDKAVSVTPTRKPLFRALEQRIMFDAAAVDTAAQVGISSVITPDVPVQDDVLLDVLAELVPPAERDRSNLIVIDQGVENYQELLDQVPENYSVLLIPAGDSGLESLADALANFENLDSIHILSHGSDNQFQLGNDKLTSESVAQYSDALARIGNALSADGDLMLYGCDLSASDEGKSLLANLAVLTGADVAASDDTTGATDLGGDWALESHSGDIEAETLSFEYNNILSGATYVTTVAAGELDSVHDATDPIEFTINMDGALPTESARLTIYAYDIDEEAGEQDDVYLNGTLLGSLKGAGDQWSTTTFEISDLSLIQAGENTVTINIGVDSDVEWVAQVDWGQLLIDGGSEEHGSITNAQLSAVSVVETSATITSQFTVNVTTTGSYRIEAQLSDQATGNVAQIVEYNFSATAGESRQITLDNSYSISAGTGVCVMSFNLFYIDSGNEVLQGQADYQFDTVENVGPSTAPTSADKTVSFNGADGYTFTSADFAFNDIDGDELSSVEITSVPSAGELRLNGVLMTSTTSVTAAQISAGNLRYTTGSDEFGTGLSNFTFQVNDGAKTSETYTLTFDVEEPSYITLSNSAFNQDDGQSFEVATLTPYSTTAGATYTYSLVSGDGSTNNDLFTVSGDKLIVTDATLIAEGSYSVRLEIVATGSVTYTYEQSFTLSVTDNLAPTSISDTNSTGDVVEGEVTYHATVSEDLAADEEIGVQLSASDTGTVSYSIEGDSPFAIDADTGVITLTTAGVLNYEASSSTSITVLVSDNHSNTSQFVVNVKLTNAAPTLANDTGTATERSSSVTGNVLTNDTDAGSSVGEDLTVTAVAGAAESIGQSVAGSNGGLFTVQADGTWSFDANGDFDDLIDGQSQTTQITLSVADSGGLGGDTTLEITVDGITATAPQLGVDGVDLDTVGTIDVNEQLSRNTMVARLSILNPESGQSFNYALVEGEGSDGNAYFSVDRGILRVLDTSNMALGEYNIRVEVSLTSGDDAGEYTIVEIITLNVVDTTAPVILGDSDRTGDDGAFDGRVAAGIANGSAVGITVDMDSDDEGKVTFSLSDDASGQFEINETTGVVTVKDGAGFDPETTASYSITAVATDAAGNEASETFSIQVLSSAQSAVDDTDTTTETRSRSGNLLNNDSDIDGDDNALEIVAVNGEASSLDTAIAGSNGGLFTIGADGDWAFDPNDEFEHVADDNTLSTTVEVTVRDSLGLLSTSTLTMAVQGDNETPSDLTLSETTYSLSPDNRVVGDFSVTDVDEGDTHTYSINRDSSGAFEVVGNQLLIAEDADISVGTYSVTIDVRDSANARIVQIMTITIVDESAPIFGEDADTNAAGDTDTANGDVLDGATQGTEVGITANAADNSDVTYSLTDDATGRFTIDADTGVITVSQSITISLSDATFFDITVRATDAFDNTADHVYRITVSDLPPVAVDDSETIIENTSDAVGGQLLTNDQNPAEDHSLLTVAEVNGSASNLASAIDGSNGGQFTVNADGTWSFTPDASFNAMQAGQTITTSVTITVADSRGSTADSTLTVTVNGENDAPETLTLSNNLIALDADSLVVGDLSSTDPDTSDTAAYSLIDVDGDGAQNSFFSLNGSQLVLTDTSITAGEATVHIQVTDAGGLTYVESFTIVVTNTAAFQITGDTNSVADDAGGAYNGMVRENAAASAEVGITVGAEFSLDPDADITFSLIDDAAGRFEIDTDTGVVTVASGASFDVTITTTHTILVQAETNGSSRTTETFTIAVAPETLITADDTATTTEHGTVGSDTAGGLFDNDGTAGDFGRPVAVTSIDGSAVFIGDGVSGSEGGTFIVNADGSWSFDAGTDFDSLDAGESLVTQVTLTVETELGESRTTLLSVTVTGEADDPKNLSLDNTTYDLASDSNKVGNLLAEDVDTDPSDRTAYLPDLPETDNDLFEVVAGELLVKDGVTLEARTDYTVTMEVSDGQGTDTTTITISVVDTETPYITGDGDATNGSTDDATQGAVAEGSYDAATAVGIQATTDHGEAVTYSIVNDAQNLVATDQFEIDSSTGVISVKSGVTLNAETHSTLSITVKATDGQGDNSTRTFVVAINNLAPQAEADAEVVSSDELSTTGNVLSNDLDAGTETANIGDDVQVSAVGGVTDNIGQSIAGSNGGSFIVNADGSWIFTLGTDFQNLQPGQTIETSVSVQVTDQPSEGTGLSDTSLLTVTVRAPADLALSENQLDLAQTATDEIGTLTPDDLAGSGPYTYTLVAGEGDDDNANFTIVGDKLSVERSDPLQEAGTYSIRVQLDDSITTSVAVFSIDLLNTSQSFEILDSNTLNNRGINPNGSGAISEGAANGTSVGITVTADQPRLPLTFSLTDDAEGRFAIDENTGEVRVVDGSAINAEDGVLDYRITVKAVESTTNIEAEYTFSVFIDNVALSANDDTAATTASATTPITGNVFDNDTDVNSTLPGDDAVVLAAGPDVDAKIVQAGSDDALSSQMSGLYGVGVGVEVAGSEGGVFTLNSDGSWSFSPDGDFDLLANGTTRVTELTVVVSDQGLALDEGDDYVVAELPDYVDGMIGEQSVTRIQVTVTGEYLGPDFVLEDTNTTSDADSYKGAVAENAANGDIVGITVDGDVADLPLSFELLDDANGRFTIDADTGVVTVADNTLLNAEHADSLVYTITVKATDTDSLKTAETTFSIKLENSALVGVDDTGTTTENASTTITGNVFDNDQDANSSLPSSDVVVLSAGTTVDNLTLNNGEPVVTTGDLGQGLTQNLAGSNGGTFTVAADGTWTFDPSGDFEYLATGESAITRVSVLIVDQGLQEAGLDVTLPDHVDGAIGTPVVTEIIVTVQGENDAPEMVGVSDPAFTIDAVEGEPLNYLFDTSKIVDPDTSHTHANRVYTLADNQDLPAGLQVLDSPPRVVGTPTETGSFSFVVRATDPDQASVFFTVDVEITEAPVTPNVPVPGNDTPTVRDSFTPPPSNTGPDAGEDEGQPIVDVFNPPGNSDNTGSDIFNSPLLNLVTTPGDNGATPPAAGDNFNPEPLGPTASGGSDTGQNAARGTQAVQLPNGQVIEPLPAGANLNDFTLDIVIELEDQLSLVDQTFSYQVPDAAFVFTSGSDQFVGPLTYRATMLDGSPLPSWLTFDADGVVFEGTPQDGDESVLDIRIIAESSDGQTATAEFKIEVNDQPVENPQASAEQADTDEVVTEEVVAAEAEAAGKAGFSDQLAQHAALENTHAQQQLLQQLAQFNFDAPTAS